jgi:hypothetical protein
MDSQDKVPYTWIATVCTPYPNCALHTSLSGLMHGEEHDDQVELASQNLCEYSPNPHSEPHNPRGIPKKETTGTTHQAAKSDTYYDPLQVVYHTHVSFAASTIARSKPGTQRTMWGKAQRHRTPRTGAAVRLPLHTVSRQTRSAGPHCTHKTTMHLTQSMCHNSVVLVTPNTQLALTKLRVTLLHSTERARTPPSRAVTPALAHQPNRPVALASVSHAQLGIYCHSQSPRTTSGATPLVICFHAATACSAQSDLQA